MRELDIKVIDGDEIARQVVEPNRTAWKKIRRKFSDEILEPDGHIDRAKLGQIIFADENNIT